MYIKNERSIEVIYRGEHTRIECQLTREYFFVAERGARARVKEESVPAYPAIYIADALTRITNLRCRAAIKLLARSYFYNARETRQPPSNRGLIENSNISGAPCVHAFDIPTWAVRI